MIRAVDHINIVVTNLARSVRFYTDVLGFAKTKEAYPDGVILELAEYRGSRPVRAG